MTVLRFYTYTVFLETKATHSLLYMLWLAGGGGAARMASFAIAAEKRPAAQTPWLALPIGSILSQMASQLAPKRYAVIVLRTMAGTSWSARADRKWTCLTAGVCRGAASHCLSQRQAGRSLLS